MRMTNTQRDIPRRSKMWHRLVFGLFMIIFLLAVFQIVSRLWEYRSSDLTYQVLHSQVEALQSSKQLADTFQQEERKSEPVPISQLTEKATLPYQVSSGSRDQLNEQGILQQYGKLHALNEDMVGWVSMPGFKKPIDYPIMWSGDNEYYLHNDFYKNASLAGSIFMEGLNDPTALQSHIILYGHAMRNFSMFGNLRDYHSTPDDYLNKTKIYVDLLHTRLEYEVFSVYTADAKDNYRQTLFDNDEEFAAFLDKIQSASLHDYGVKLGPQEKILTLSTCDESLYEDGRSVIHARLVSQVVYDGSAVQTEGTDAGNEAQKSVKDPVLANVYLKQLKLSYAEDGSVVEKALISSADNLIKQFSLEVPAEAITVSLSMITTDPEATIQAAVNQVKADPAGKLQLQDGENEIRLKIMSRDLQYARYYTIKIMRSAS
ncbi:class B sortase [Paenibacillus sp. 2TAB23]|uniref:class B sortase n=1 Tax=Paenibacillus sp. 2TAB23 TaxID=3233004 RepID=UPI003F996204